MDRGAWWLQRVGHDWSDLALTDGKQGDMAITHAAASSGMCSPPSPLYHTSGHGSPLSRSLQVLQRCCFFSPGTCFSYMLPLQSHKRRTGRKWSCRNQEGRGLQKCLNEVVKKFGLNWQFSRKSVISLGEISGFKSHSLDYRRWRVNENKLPTAFRQLFQEMICERKRAKRQKLNRDMWKRRTSFCMSRTDLDMTWETRSLGIGGILDILYLQHPDPLFTLFHSAVSSWLLWR